jgi:nucleotide-binding universal stress UspA family protein
MPDSHTPDPQLPAERLLFVADAAVADVEELPPPVRDMVAGAAEVYVVTPSLPGRLAWLADDVDRFRHVADERLDTVLDHMRLAGANARGRALRGSVLTVLTDAVESFEPDHILLALRSAEHANWQEHRLVEHVERRFGLPVTSYAVDADGHASRADGPLLLCYDGSPDAENAIARAGALFRGGDAVVLTVWEASAGLGNFGWAGEGAGTVDYFELDRAAGENCERVALAGARAAQEAGLRAVPLAVRAAGPVWEAIIAAADTSDAGAIVMGSRGLSGIRSMLLGSVSAAVVRNAERPTLVVRRPETSPRPDVRRESAAHA